MSNENELEEKATSCPDKPRIHIIKNEDILSTILAETQVEYDAITKINNYYCQLEQ